jgi:hypothetical protein
LAAGVLWVNRLIDNKEATTTPKLSKTQPKRIHNTQSKIQRHHLTTIMEIQQEHAKDSCSVDAAMSHPATIALQKLSYGLAQPQCLSFSVLGWPQLPTKTKRKKASAPVLEDPALDFPSIEWSSNDENINNSSSRRPTAASISQCLKSALEVVGGVEEEDMFRKEETPHRPLKRRCIESLGGMRRSSAIPSSLQNLNQAPCMPRNKPIDQNRDNCPLNEERLVSSRTSFPLTLPRLSDDFSSKLLFSNGTKFSKKYRHSSRTSKPNCTVSPLA